jgi:2-phospho-L-lactate guanylyltransferase
VQNWTVVIPVKGTGAAKSRLGASPDLAMAIGLDSVEAALGAARVIVVTSKCAAPQFAALGAEVVEDAGGGLLAAVRQGIVAAGQERVAVMLGDVPALTPAELRAALELALAHPLAFVPDAESEGTVLITALSGADHAPAFGAASRVAHLAAGYVELTVPADSGLRRDVDTPDQLASVPSAALGTRTRTAAAKNYPNSGLEDATRSPARDQANSLIQ